MANSKSSKKRVIVAERNRLRNQAVKSRVKTFVKKLLTAIELKDAAAATASLVTAQKELDKAVSKGILNKNAVSRKKSRLSARVNAL